MREAWSRGRFTLSLTRVRHAIRLLTLLYTHAATLVSSRGLVGELDRVADGRPDECRERVSEGGRARKNSVEDSE
jgi:hypothetical protein